MDREAQRRALAISFYICSCIIVACPIGFWAQWSLGGRNPWIWAIFWLTQGRTGWIRPAMLLYWALIGSFSVGAWSRQLARSRKFQRINGTGIPVDPAFATDNMAVPASPGPASGFSHVATDILDAADRRVPTLSLNARRKSFHALALFMFLPGIIIDVSLLGNLIPPTYPRIACLHPLLLQRCFRPFRVCRIHPLLCSVPVWQIHSHLPARICGLKGQRVCHSQPLLPPHWLC